MLYLIFHPQFKYMFHIFTFTLVIFYSLIYIMSFIYFRHTSRTSRRKYLPSQSSCRKEPSNNFDEGLRGYIMVANCPSSWKFSETAQACSSTNYTANPLTALPVVDMVTKVTYANAYCALCHNTSRDLHMWSLWMKSRNISQHELTLADIKSPHVLWKAVPVGDVTPDKCLLTPPEAKTAPDTKDKRLCRSYALVTCRSKNPHCGLLTRQSLSDILAPCGVFFLSLRAHLRSTVFVFSIYGKKSKKFDEKLCL